MGAVESAKSVGKVVSVVVVFLAVMAIPIALLYGAASVSVWALDYLPNVLGWALALSLVVLSPLALIAPTRGLAGNGFVIASYAFGLSLWLLAMAYTYLDWGLFPVIVGLFLGGVGIIPVAIILTLFDSAWTVLGNLVGLVVLTIGSRALGYWLIEKAAIRQFAIEQEQLEKETVMPAKRL